MECATFIQQQQLAALLRGINENLAQVLSSLVEFSCFIKTPAVSVARFDYGVRNLGCAICGVMPPHSRYGGVGVKMRALSMLDSRLRGNDEKCQTY